MLMDAYLGWLGPLLFNDTSEVVFVQDADLVLDLFRLKAKSLA